MNIQVVHTRKPDGSVTHHARIRGNNNEIVWVTESYNQRSSAFNAIDLLLDLAPTTAGGGLMVEEVWAEGEGEGEGEAGGVS